MNKSLAVYLFLLGIITYAHAADITVEVGGPKGGNVFIPNPVLATVGDNIVFTWKTGKHSIIESDAAKSCAKSLKADAFTSGGAFMAPKTWTLPADVAGKTWFYCGVPGHCTPGIGGMEGTLIISPGKAAPPPGKGAPPTPGKSAPGKGVPPTPGKGAPSKGVPPTPGKGALPPGKAPPAPSKAAPEPDKGEVDNNNTDNKASTIGAIIGGLFGGISLTIGSFFLYKKFKFKRNDAILIPGDNKNNKDVILIPGSNEISENENKYHSDSNTVVYNHEQEANQFNHGRETNHGQESISISENNDTSSLKNYIYITQIVRQ